MEEFILSADLSDSRIVIFAVDAEDEADIEQLMTKDQIVAKNLQTMTSQRAFMCPWCKRGPIVTAQQKCPNPACGQDFTSAENREVLRKTPAMNVPGTLPRAPQCDSKEPLRIKTCNVVAWALLDVEGQLYALWKTTNEQLADEMKIRAAEQAGVTIATDMRQADALAKQQAAMDKSVKAGPGGDSSKLKIVRP